MMNLNFDNIGAFQEKDKGHWFTYRPTTNQWALENGYLHEVDVLDGYRFATVKKTVVYICVDEDEFGEPVVEHWQIKKHEVYSKKS